MSASGIEPGLLSRLKETLQNCDEFESDRALRAIFVDARIVVWRAGLPKADKDSERVDVTIDYLVDRSNQKQERALILLLEVLKDRHPDHLQTELTQLIEELGRIAVSAAAPQTPPPGEATAPPATSPTPASSAGVESPVTPPQSAIEPATLAATPLPGEVAMPTATLPITQPALPSKSTMTLPGAPSSQRAAFHPPFSRRTMLISLGILAAVIVVIVLITKFTQKPPIDGNHLPEITIQSLHNGDIVTREALVSGTFQNLGADWHIWWIVRPEDGNHWVQGYLNPDESEGEWAYSVRFGVEDTRDIGEDFALIVLAVRKDSNANKVLNTAYGKQENYVAASDFPSDVPAITQITVTRGSPIDYWLADFWPDDDQTAQPVTTTQITSPYLFQEWWAAPFAGLPEEGWTARFAKRIDLAQDAEYCFYRVSDSRVDVTLDGSGLAFVPEAAGELQVASVCQTLPAGLHDVRVNLSDTGGERTWVELWYDGPGIPIPTGPLTETWQAAFYPHINMTKKPVLRTSFTSDDLNFTEASTGDIPVVSYKAVLTRTFTLEESGTYRFEMWTDDGVRLSICGTEVLDEFHGGPGSYVVDRYLEAGEHMLSVDFYEYIGTERVKIQWERIPDPVLPVQRILFISDRDDDGDEIFIADADGSNPQQLTHNSYPDRDPAWSPDGQHIVFAAALEEDGVYNLYVMNADGSDPRLLIERGGQPRWSPDGSRIVFVRWFSENEQSLWLVNADGTGEHPLIEGQMVNYNPDWSPDGARIAFESFRDGNAEIYVVNADGSGLQNLSNSPDTWDGTPAWSPNGETIAFASHREDNTDIYIMNADGSDVRRITEWGMEDACPDWSPDGHFLVFHGGDEWGGEIYKKDPYTDADRIALTDASGRHEKPQWSPAGYGYAVSAFTDGDAVNPGAIAVTEDFVWTGGSGGLLRWGRNDPNEQRKYTAADGLVGNDVRSLLEVDAGTLWFSVGHWPFYDEGWGQLTFSDTEKWRTFTPGDGLHAEQVFVLYRDNQERIWAGTDNGLWMHDGQSWQAWLPSMDGVSVIYQASDGALWLDTPGPEVWRYMPTVPGEDTAEAFDLMALLESGNDGYRYASAIVEGEPGEIWFGTNASIVRYDGETWSVPDDELRRWTHAILRDNDGTLWIGIDGWEGKRLIRRDPDGSLRIYAEDDGIQSDITALALDEEGTLWAAGDALYRYDREADHWEAYWAHDDEQHNDVGVIFQDTQGALWLGHSIFYRAGDGDYTWSEGVSRYAPEAPEVWQHFSKGAIHTIAEDNKNVLWFGADTDGRGACSYNLTSEQWGKCYTTNRLASDNVDAILSAQDGSLWIGTSDGGLTRIDGEFSDTFRQEANKLLSDNVHCLVQDKEGALWVTTDEGVNRFFYEENRWGSLTTQDGLLADEVLAVALEGEDSIWLGTREGLTHYNYVIKDSFNIPDAPQIPDWAMNCQQRLLVDRYGTLWVATDEGLYRRTPEGDWLHLTTANGLASNHILAVYEDKDGAIWLGTPYGINRLQITATKP